MRREKKKEREREREREGLTSFSAMFLVNQALAETAFVMVSCVVKVFDATMKRVVSGFSLLKEERGRERRISTGKAREGGDIRE